MIIQQEMYIGLQDIRGALKQGVVAAPSPRPSATSGDCKRESPDHHEGPTRERSSHHKCSGGSSAATMDAGATASFGAPPSPLAASVEGAETNRGAMSGRQI